MSRKTQAMKKSDDYTRGALLEVDDQVQKVVGNLPELIVTSQQESIAEDEGYDENELMEGDRVVRFAVPKPEDSEEEL